jgi:peptidoglycan/LPS O-acetylase OafA/YrhL
VSTDSAAAGAPESALRIDGDHVAAPAGFGGYLGQFDSYRVVACCAVVLQHSLLWTITVGNVVPWAFVMLLHFSRTAFFFLTALVLTYSQLTRPLSTRDFWRRRYVQLGVPYLAWTLIYWIYTLLTVPGSGSQAWYLLWHDVLFGYYQLYFAVVLFQLYVVFPFLLRFLRSVGHHGWIMVASLVFALLLSADLHFSHFFGPVGAATRWMSTVWPFGRDLITYQEQFIAGILVALHFDQVRQFVERWCRQIIALALAIGVIATLWYLLAVWTGSDTGHASDLYQPIAFLWFTAAVAGLEAFTWWWYRRTTVGGHRPLFTAVSATYLASLTGGIYLCHILFINEVRRLIGVTGLSHHLGWSETVAVLFVGTILISGLFTALILRTPLRWVLGGPVRAEQRSRIDGLAADASALRRPTAAHGGRPGTANTNVAAADVATAVGPSPSHQ